MKSFRINVVKLLGEQEGSKERGKFTMLLSQIKLVRWALVGLLIFSVVGLTSVTAHQYKIIFDKLDVIEEEDDWWNDDPYIVYQINDGGLLAYGQLAIPVDSHGNRRCDIDKRTSNVPLNPSAIYGPNGVSLQPFAAQVLEGFIAISYQMIEDDPQCGSSDLGRLTMAIEASIGLFSDIISGLANGARALGGDPVAIAQLVKDGISAMVDLVKLLLAIFDGPHLIGGGMITFTPAQLKALKGKEDPLGPIEARGSHLGSDYHWKLHYKVEEVVSP